MRSKALFGPGGNSEAFYRDGCKSTRQAPAWVKRIGLDAYEFEAGNGISAGDETLAAIGAAAYDEGVHMSLHSPYYISLSGVIPEKRLKSIDYIKSSLHAAALLRAKTVVVHTGSAAKIDRSEAMKLAADTLDRTLAEVGEDGAFIGLETMGKINQLGTLEEVIALCKMSRRLVPVVDFGHMNARACGGVFPDVDAYRRIFSAIGEALDDQTARNLHCHFSKIEWTGAGEKKHLTFEDAVYGPDFEPLMECLVRENLTPTVICESAGTMSDDALAMKKSYERALAQWKN